MQILHCRGEVVVLLTLALLKTQLYIDKQQTTRK